jgi:hypothetical protein
MRICFIGKASLKDEYESLVKLRKPTRAILIGKCGPICAHLEYLPCFVFLLGHLYKNP